MKILILLLLAFPVLASIEVPYHLQDLEEHSAADINENFRALSVAADPGRDNKFTGNNEFTGAVKGVFDISFSSGTSDLTEDSGVWSTVTGSSSTITLYEGSRLHVQFDSYGSNNAGGSECEIRLMRGDTPAAGAPHGEVRTAADYKTRLGFVFITEALSAGTTTFSVMFRRDVSNVCTIYGSPGWHFLLEEVQ